jgi:hypothetical protein
MKMFKFALAAVLVAPLASFGCDYTRLAVAASHYDTVRLVKASHCEDTVAVADDYASDVQVVRVRRLVRVDAGYDYGHNVQIVNGHDVRLVGNGRRRVGNGNGGGSGVVGIIKAAVNTVKNVGRAVVGG